MDAIKQALSAILCAYRVRHSCAPEVPDEEDLMLYIVQQIQNPTAAKQLGKTLDEKSVDEFIKPSALIVLVQLAFEAQQLRRRLDESEKEANAAWKLIGSAGRIIRNKVGTAHKRHSDALYELGLIGEKHGQDRNDSKHQDAADRYFFLRTGGHEWHKGELIHVKPRSHDDSVNAVMDEFNVNDWESLERTWRNKGIQVSYNAEVFPVK